MWRRVRALKYDGRENNSRAMLGVPFALISRRHQQRLRSHTIHLSSRWKIWCEFMESQTKKLFGIFVQYTKEVEIPLVLFLLIYSRWWNVKNTQKPLSRKRQTFSANILKAFADQISLTFPVKMAVAGTSVADFNFPSALSFWVTSCRPLLVSGLSLAFCVLSAAAELSVSAAAALRTGTRALQILKSNTTQYLFAASPCWLLSSQQTHAG